MGYRLSKRRLERAESWLNREVWANTHVHTLALQGLVKRAGARETEEGLESWPLSSLENMTVHDVLDAAMGHADEYPRQQLRLVPADDDGNSITTRQKTHRLTFDRTPDGVNPDSRGADAATEAISAASARLLATAATTGEKSATRADALSMEVVSLAKEAADDRLEAVSKAQEERLDAKIDSAVAAIQLQFQEAQLDQAEKTIDEMEKTIGDLQGDLEAAEQRIAELEAQPNIWEEMLRPIAPQLAGAIVPLVNAVAVRVASGLAAPPQVSQPPPAAAAAPDPA